MNACMKNQKLSSLNKKPQKQMKRDREGGKTDRETDVHAMLMPNMDGKDDIPEHPGCTKDRSPAASANHDSTDWICCGSAAEAFSDIPQSSLRVLRGVVSGVVNRMISYNASGKRRAEKNNSGTIANRITQYEQHEKIKDDERTKRTTTRRKTHTGR